MSERPFDQDDDHPPHHVGTLAADGTPCRGAPTPEELELWAAEERELEAQRERDALATAGFGIDAELEAGEK